MSKKTSLSLIYSTLFIVLLFIVAGIFANHYSEAIASAIQTYNTLGKVTLVLMATIAVIFPFWSNLFLLPFAVVAWGPITTALLCIVGWWIGSMIAFFIARTYQHRLLKKFPSLAHYEYVDALVSKKYEFLTLIFLRMTLPVDILSYALGLFSSRISWQRNSITTLIGIIPFAFLFSYIGAFPSRTQIAIFSLTALFVIIYLILQKPKGEATA